MSLLAQIKEVERQIMDRETYNTSIEINGYELEIKDGNRICIFINYLIYPSEDIPAMESFAWFEIDSYPTVSELEELKESNRHLYIHSESQLKLI